MGIEWFLRIWNNKDNIMTQKQIIADYKKARHITDEYVLDEDEMYFVEQIYLLHQEQVKNCSIHDVSCCDTCGKELTNIGGSQMYCHNCGTTKIGCN